LGEAFSDDPDNLLADAVSSGLITQGDAGLELHPLIREYLHTKLVSRPDAATQVREAFGLSLRSEAWDHAFELLSRFGADDLIDPLVEEGFKPLLHAGRITTLEQISRHAHRVGEAVSPLVDLLDAELAYRDGQLPLAESLAHRVTRRLDQTHPLRSRAYWLAGQAAQLTANHQNAREHFRAAREAALDDEDSCDAAWGFALTSIYFESRDADAAVAELMTLRDKSAKDLVRAVTGTLLLMRHTTGVREAPGVEEALDALPLVREPRIRTSFTNTRAYQLILSGRYSDALALYENMLADVEAFQLGYVRPHAHWGLAAANLGLRRFGTADRWLQRMEHAADASREGFLTLNAAVLRARLLLTLQRPEDACRALIIDEALQAHRSIRGEVLATRALALAVSGDFDRSMMLATEAEELTLAADARALAASAKAVVAQRMGHSDELARSIATPVRLGVWDALICSVRAWPELLPELAVSATVGSGLQIALRRSNDYELASRAGLSLGRRPRSERSVLSPREREVLELVRQGLTNAAIASALFMSEATVKVHVRHILEKVGARTRTEAATRVLDD
jgi:DNA-binding NarL/FixJ family response regulator